ncbi:hypothetical protein DFP92_10549 [Yoonia sediminilitoris]|uniref:Uncharacterized protein n=1 Tax=Yoonia sediminilitoris TaxID=1286148 RepID=A0A2T6KH43_9RHOB|nr:hypothetical protein C8N45_10549 [Yoonia sediminilitoris]RCW95545.1 hypothetical protein DFP92_10549 [Yoonia sediminilitoris]
MHASEKSGDELHWTTAFNQLDIFATGTELSAQYLKAAHGLPCVADAYVNRGIAIFRIRIRYQMLAKMRVAHVVRCQLVQNR